jgi:hypothetical protein
MEDEMAEKEYAGKGVAGTGLGLGIAGTALALLNNNNGDGLLGILGGGGGGKYAELRAENVQLKSQVYTDGQLRPIVVEQARQAEQIACIQNRFATEREITDGKIANAVLETAVTTTRLSGAIECLQNTVAGIATTYVPAGKVTPMPQPMAFPPTPVPGFGPWYPYPPPPPPPVVVVPPAADSGTATTNAGGTTTGG